MNSQKWKWEMRLHRAIGISIACLLAYWAIDRANPAPNAQPPKLETPYVRNGDELKISYVVDRKRECPVVIYRTIIDATKVRWELETYNLASAGPVGHDEYTRAVVVPWKTADGPAKYRVVLVYTCNPLHTIVPLIVRLPDIDFEIM